MEKIIVTVDFGGKNYSAAVGHPVLGAVLMTSKSAYEDVQREFQETFREHIRSMMVDGEEVPEWCVSGDYELEFQLTTAALLQSLGADVSLASISRATGINQTQLSHYANGIKVPRPQQQQRIIEGIHSIGRRLLAV